VLKLLVFDKKLGEIMDFHLLGVISGVLLGFFVGYYLLLRNGKIE